MRLIVILLFSACLHVSAAGYGQKVSLRETNAPLKKIFTSIHQQTGYEFFYGEELLTGSKPVSIDVNSVSLEEALKFTLQGQNLTFSIIGNNVVIKPTAGLSPRIDDPRPVLTTSAPPINISGRVVDENGNPVSGASVTVKGSKRGTATNANGEFVLNDIDEKAVLVVSGINIQDEEFILSGQSFIAITTRQVIKEEEQVVVAYNKIKERSNVGAVTVVKGEQIQNLPNRSFDKSLQGLVPGLLVTSGNGQPGSPPANFILRGIATGGQPINGETFRNPLIVVDGIPVSQEPPGIASPSGGSLTDRITNPLAQLNPSDIETISVLKDAAAVALYGSQASNGVILVTTKKGKAGKTVFSFRNQTDIASALDGNIKMLNQQEYLEVLYEAHRNTNPIFWTDARIDSSLKEKFPVGPDGNFYPQSDWTSAFLNNAAVTMANEISMSGGNDKSIFYLNLEYTKQNGTAKKSGYDRKSIRFNYEHRPTSWMKLGLSTTLSYNIQKYSNEGAGSFFKVAAISPLNPIRDIAGKYIYRYAWGHGGAGGTFSPNPVAQTELDINTSTAYRGLSKLFAEAKVLKNLTFSSSLGLDFMLNEAKQKAHPLVNPPGNIAEQLFRSTSIINTNLLQFNKLWSKRHSLIVLAGQEVRILSNKYVYVLKRDIIGNPGLDQLSGGNIISNATGSVSKQTMASYFGQVSYGYREKYYLSTSLRSDGASRFGKNNRFGTYWSVGGGWIVSAESFMKKTSSWLNSLKLRGSMGPAGNSTAVTDQLRFDPLLLVNFLNGIAVYPGQGSAPGNPSIQWEETFVWDAGLELRLLKDKINITADIYNRKTKNLIAYNINAPLGTGYSQLTENVGDVKNSGIELSLSANIIQYKDFRWNVNANWSRNQNKLTKSFLPRSTVVGTNLVNEVGYEYNSFFLSEWAGVNPSNGRPMWMDSTGKPSENYHASKPSIVGKAQPDGFGSINSSFSYKGIGLSFGLYFQYGSKVYLNSNLQNDGSSNPNDPYLNQMRNALDRWQKPGDIATNPRRLLNGQAITSSGTIIDQGALPSTRFLYDGDFIRLSNIGLSYDFPKRLIERLHLSTVRIYVQAHNIATWSQYSGDDPENVGPSGFGSILYPQSKSYSVGLNVNF